MFLMATSAIGPGFITQTTQFTAQLGAAFAFAILVSILVDIALQLNVWRVIGVSGLRAQELGNRVLPGLGHVLTFFVVLGGLVFNIGNVAGAGPGARRDARARPEVGRGGLRADRHRRYSCRAAPASRWTASWSCSACVMIAMTGYVALVSQPPVGAALRNAVVPERVDFLAITTLVGGTVGGYITYAGAHRLLDSGVRGPGRSPRSRALGDRHAGHRGDAGAAVPRRPRCGRGRRALDPANPAASAFQPRPARSACGCSGVILWAAAITSVIGASYTSVSFLAAAASNTTRRRTCWSSPSSAVGGVYLAAGAAPVPLLIFAGAFNGLILPIGMAVLLWVAWRRRTCSADTLSPLAGRARRGRLARHGLPGLAVARPAWDVDALAAAMVRCAALYILRTAQLERSSFRRSKSFRKSIAYCAERGIKVAQNKQQTVHRFALSPVGAWRILDSLPERDSTASKDRQVKDMISDKSLLPIRSTARNRLFPLKALGLLATGLLSLPTTASSAIVATIDFETSTAHNAPVGSFYAGVIFSSNALGLIDNNSSADVDLGLGGTGLFENQPSPSTIMHFQEAADVTLNYAAGLTGGFSFYYTTLDSLGSVSACDGTGNLIGSSISLGAQTHDPDRDAPTITCSACGISSNCL